jgi:hypothetical protein
VHARRESADDPQDDQDDKYEAQYAAETGAAIATVRIVPAAAAEQDDNENYYENRTHDGCPSSETPEQILTLIELNGTAL